ncbi:DUF2865 domain-containing protein [Bradyrhizobium sp. WSM 1738]|uniref:DUF2865 domain-containing protein n=1 Tax=Bradyrhizobium hereditatis TaxID=2821405 RepID=UPI001CE23568|nr:DUF2865 domain-containing protein [Bradyrhizobium hereditatis]MCA6117951.1 DUF2865 domain-containing protein [Bradyrhizobium hereditatis]
MRTGKLAVWGTAALVCASVLAPTAQAQDFFSQLFGGFARPRHQPYVQMPFAGNDGEVYAPRGEGRSRSYGGGSQAYCVRTCDGRYFPVTASDNASRAAACNKLCPASETKVYSGGNIDDATAENGKSYSELPNAFRYRNELVGGCTCNGKDPVGLAQVKIEDDPTLRKGDIVAGANGLLVAGRSGDRRGAELNFSPAPDKVRAKYGQAPVVARE